MSKFEGLPEHSQPSGGATPKSAATEALLPSAVLAAAAEVAQKGWRQRRYYDEETGCRCIVGALSFALNGTRSGAEDDGVAGALMPFIANAAGLQRAAGVDELISWNDAPGRTQAHVVAVLRQASEHAKSEGC